MKPVSAGSITGLLKPKYKVISNVLGECYLPQHGFDIFLDLNTVLSVLSSYSKYMNGLPFNPNAETDLLSCTLMILKHWKDYARRWDRIADIRIFMIVNDLEMGAMPESKQISGYLVPFLNKFSNEKMTQFKEIWTKTMDRIEVILKYIPGMYLIRCNRFDSYIIPEIIDNYQENKRDRLIVTGNSLFTNYCYMPKTRVMYTKYRTTGMCQVSDPLMIVQSISRIDEDIMGTFIRNRVFYNLLNAIIGDYDRGIIGLTQIGISTFAADLLRAVEKYEIPSNPMSVESVFPAINENYHEYLLKSYPLIDIPTHAMMIPQSMIEKVKSKMVDMYDIDGLRQLTVDGLNLLELL